MDTFLLIKVCVTIKVYFSLRFVSRYLNDVSICLPRCPGGLKDAHLMYFNLNILSELEQYNIEINTCGLECVYCF